MTHGSTLNFEITIIIIILNLLPCIQVMHARIGPLKFAIMRFNILSNKKYNTYTNMQHKYTQWQNIVCYWMVKRNKIVLYFLYAILHEIDSNRTMFCYCMRVCIRSLDKYIFSLSRMLKCLSTQWLYISPLIQIIFKYLI